MDGEAMRDKHVEAANGDRAKALLDNDTHRDAIAQLRLDYIAAWEMTGINDATAREKLYLRVKMLDDFQSQLIKVVNNGKLAKAEIEALSRNKAA
jgi:hypothetical protein